MEACLDEELPPTTELEEGLRNGVYLAKLGNFFAPRTVSLKKIYDREQTRYKVKTCGTTKCGTVRPTIDTAVTTFKQSGAVGGA